MIFFYADPDIMIIDYTSVYSAMPVFVSRSNNCNWKIWKSKNCKW